MAAAGRFENKPGSDGIVAIQAFLGADDDHVLMFGPLPYALACARFIPERLKGCAVVSGLPPLTVKGEKLDPSHYLMAEELLMARLAKTVPFAARAIFRYVLWQLHKDPANAMKQVKGVTAGDIELLKHQEMKRALVDGQTVLPVAIA